MDQDRQHLNLLAVLHYVLAGIVAFFASFFLMHVVVGIVILTAPEKFDGAQSPEQAQVMGTMFTVIGTIVVLAGWSLAAFIIACGRRLARHRSRTFCLVIAAIECLAMPLGTILGIFTILVLTRPSVQALFEAGNLPEAANE